MDSGVSKTSLPFSLWYEARGFFEELGIHVLLEVILVWIVNSFLDNTFLSILAGICIVEGCQLLWRIRRNNEDG